VTVRVIHVQENLLAVNDVVAGRNRQRFDQAGVLAVNLIASPGAGKTSLIAATLRALAGRVRVAVIEGDIAGSLDAERALAAGAAAAVQINTGGGCHLEAHMVERALADLDLAGLDGVFIENVGNLVCPNHWALGEHLKVCVASTAEGHDKPVKYPEVFAASDAIVLNKLDLLDLSGFERDQFYPAVRALNPAAPVFELSCRTGQGLAAWVDWLMARRAQPTALLMRAAVEPNA
jgi:hydrogenase nickel incorporation protein HypB